MKAHEKLSCTPPTHRSIAKNKFTGPDQKFKTSYTSRSHPIVRQKRWKNSKKKSERPPTWWATSQS